MKCFSINATSLIAGSRIFFFFFGWCVIFFGFFQAETWMMIRYRVLGVIALFVAITYAAKDDKNPDVGTVIGIDLGTTYSWWVEFKTGITRCTPPYMLSFVNEDPNVGKIKSVLRGLGLYNWHGFLCYPGLWKLQGFFD